MKENAMLTDKTTTTENKRGIPTFPFPQAIPWNSKEGVNLLNQSRYRTSFYELTKNFQPCSTPCRCAFATMITILNTLFKNGSEKCYFYQNNSFYNGLPIHKFDNNGNGISLKLFQMMIGAHRVKTTIKYASPNLHIESFRSDLMENLNKSSKFIIANFLSPDRGHISPIVAYDKKHDYLLVMDVATHKNSWYWVPTHYFFNAMQTLDNENFRGYLIVERLSV